MAGAAFQRNAFQSNAFQVDEIVESRPFKKERRQYLFVGQLPIYKKIHQFGSQSFVRRVDDYEKG